jgi:chromosome segregation ATPase
MTTNQSAMNLIDLIEHRATLLSQLAAVEKQINTLQHQPRYIEAGLNKLKFTLEKLPFKNEYTATELNQLSAHWRKLMRNLKRPWNDVQKQSAEALLSKLAMSYTDGVNNSRTFHRW